VSISLTTASVLSAASLKKVWAVVREDYANQLIRDPLDLLAFEANLDSNLKQLSYSVRADAYRPVPPVTTRAAKRDGLTRALSVLDVTDTLVLKAIIDAMQDLLLAGYPDWVGFSRSHVKSLRETPEDYESWIQAWLRHEKSVKSILRRRGCRFMVTADIASFFPSISHRLLRQLVVQRTGADETLINLLFFILECMSWRPAYCEDRETGLPQEDYDASRVLAHAFVKAVDDCMAKEGNDGRYVRWVDDIMVAVTTVREGRKLLSHLQRCLEDRGLILSSAKSKIVPLSEFQKALYPSENAFLDKVHEASAGRAKRRVTVRTFDKHLTAFLTVPDKLSTWDRILKRYYTQSRRVGSALLENLAFEHIRAFPSLSSHILDYLRGRPFVPAILSGATDYLASEDNIYEDVEIRIVEFLLDWRIPLSVPECPKMVSQALDHFFGRAGRAKPLTAHGLGLLALLIYKYGQASDISQLAGYFLTHSVIDPLTMRFGITVLCGTDAYRDQALAAGQRYEHRGLRRVHLLMAELDDNPAPFEKLLKKRICASQKHSPDYWFLSARTLPAIRLVRRNSAFRATWDAHLTSVLKKLESSRRDMQDFGSIEWLRAELSRP